jgi:lysophospholipase L1-like esterase
MKTINLRAWAFAFIIITATMGRALAQETPPFYDDVQTIKKYDKIYEAPKDPIVFTGSSSIRLWSGMAKAFPDLTVLNRGVGGTRTNDITRYVDDLIVPYKPKQVVIYVGENDVTDETLNADSIFARFKVLYSTIRAKLPATPLVYIAMKPSPSRVKYVDKVKGVNAQVSQFIKTEKNIVFVDIYPLMVDGKGNIKVELFRADRLHMKPEGYALWEKTLRPYLLK